LRKDLGYGAATGWNFGEEVLFLSCCYVFYPLPSICIANHLSLQGAIRCQSLLCPRHLRPSKRPWYLASGLTLEMMLKFPLDSIEVAHFQNLLATHKPNKSYAFVFDHRLWNDLDLQATANWLDGILRLRNSVLPTSNTHSGCAYSSHRTLQGFWSQINGSPVNGIKLYRSSEVEKKTDRI